MINFIDLTGWSLRIYDKPPKGSRKSNVYENPETQGLYFFKLSKESYPSEIWSEIVSSHLGIKMGFDVLRYDLGFDGENYGCISPSMIDKDEGEILYHGVDVLNDYLRTFKITPKPIHSFQDLEIICGEIKEFNLFLDYFIELIVFDAIIGNTDRHTENWSLIKKFKHVNEINFETDQPEFRNFFSSIGSIINWFFKTISSEHTIKCSPIYDSGSCLGREIGMQKSIESLTEIDSFLADEDKVEKYMLRAQSEIRWEGDKISLFDMVNKLNEKYPKKIKEILKKVYSFGTEKNIDNLIDLADINIIGKFDDTFLSLHRKEVIKTLLKRRIQHLKKNIPID